MKTKTLLGMMGASVLVAGTAGYIVGKNTAFDGESYLSSSASGTTGNSLHAGLDSETSGERGVGGPSLSTRLTLGNVSEASWHQYAGPFTAESWMAIRQAVFNAPLSQVEDTLAKLAELPISQERLELQRELLAMWATQDPLAAMEYAANIDIREERSDAREDILQVWASSEPGAAFDWLESQQGVMPEGEYNRIFDDAIRGYADLNLSEAINYFNTLSDTLNQRLIRSGLDEIAKSMIQQGRLDEATDLIAQLDDPELRTQASRELMSELAEVDLDQALTLLESYVDTDTYRSMQRELVEEWAENDPAEAADYITNSVDVGDEFSDMASRVMRNWDDLAAASEWLSQYDPSPELDRPTMTLVFRASREDPEAALSWAGTLTDDRMQSRALSVVASSWKATDAAAVTEYLSQASDLTPEQKQIIQDVPARRFGTWNGRR